jgi:hypothetical protein
MSEYNRKNFLVLPGHYSLPPAGLRLSRLGISFAPGHTTELAQSTCESYTFTTLAGLAGTSGSADGVENDTRFDLP